MRSGKAWFGVVNGRAHDKDRRVAADRIREAFLGEIPPYELPLGSIHCLIQVVDDAAERDRALNGRSLRGSLLTDAAVCNIPVNEQGATVLGRSRRPNVDLEFHGYLVASQDQVADWSNHRG